LIGIMPGDRHHEIESRSLRLHVAVADALASDSERVLRIAQGNLTRWLRSNPQSLAYRRWAEILDEWTVDRIIALLRSEDAEAVQLRQSSPFCGVLPENRRLELMGLHDADRA
jgi:hypothetical protein